MLGEVVLRTSHARPEGLQGGSAVEWSSNVSAGDTHLFSASELSYALCSKIRLIRASKSFRQASRVITTSCITKQSSYSIASTREPTALLPHLALYHTLILLTGAVYFIHCSVQVVKQVRPVASMQVTSSWWQFILQR